MRVLWVSCVLIGSITCVPPQSAYGQDLSKPTQSCQKLKNIWTIQILEIISLANYDRLHKYKIGTLTFFELHKKATSMVHEPAVGLVYLSLQAGSSRKLLARLICLTQTDIYKWHCFTGSYQLEFFFWPTAGIINFLECCHHYEVARQPAKTSSLFMIPTVS